MKLVFNGFDLVPLKYFCGNYYQLHWLPQLCHRCAHSSSTIIITSVVQFIIRTCTKEGISVLDPGPPLPLMLVSGTCLNALSHLLGFALFRGHVVQHLHNLAKEGCQRIDRLNSRRSHLTRHMKPLRLCEPLHMFQQRLTQLHSGVEQKSQLCRRHLFKANII